MKKFASNDEYYEPYSNANTESDAHMLAPLNQYDVFAGGEEGWPYDDDDRVATDYYEGEWH